MMKKIILYINIINNINIIKTNNKTFKRKVCKINKNKIKKFKNFNKSSFWDKIK